MGNTVPEPSGAHWVTSSYSSGNAQCVELVHTPGRTLLRDSKLGETSPVLSIAQDNWHAFTTQVKSGTYDRD